MLKKTTSKYNKVLKSWKNKLSDAGGVSSGGTETTPTRRKADVFL